MRVRYPAKAGTHNHGDRFCVDRAGTRAGAARPLGMLHGRATPPAPTDVPAFLWEAAEGLRLSATRASASSVRTLLHRMADDLTNRATVLELDAMNRCMRGKG